MFLSLQLIMHKPQLAKSEVRKLQLRLPDTSSIVEFEIVASPNVNLQPYRPVSSTLTSIKEREALLGR